MSFKNWITGIYVTKTLGNGYRVGIDGCDVFDDINQFGVKTRRTFAILEEIETKEEAKEKAIQWLEEQIRLLRKS